MSSLASHYVFLHAVKRAVQQEINNASLSCNNEVNWAKHEGKLELHTCQWMKSDFSLMLLNYLPTLRNNSWKLFEMHISAIRTMALAI